MTKEMMAVVFTQIPTETARDCCNAIYQILVEKSNEVKSVRATNERMGWIDSSDLISRSLALSQMIYHIQEKCAEDRLEEKKKKG